MIASTTQVGLIQALDCAMSSIPAETLYCRLRNRIIEHLQLVSSAEEQLAYQQSAPIAQVSNELFNAWGDWVADEATIEEFTAPVFSAEEQLAVREFNAALDAVFPPDSARPAVHH